MRGKSFIRDEATRSIIAEALRCIPFKTKVYLVGGTLRNAVHARYFTRHLQQRDYDLFVIGNPYKFIANLRKIGFTYGKLKRKDERTVKKKKFPSARALSDFVVFDIHFATLNIRANLRKNVNFTVNGFALPFEKALASDWHNYLIAIKGAEKDVREQKLRVNAFHHPAQLYACIRFIHKGFKHPSPPEIKGLLLLLGRLRKNQLRRNLNKVFEGAGGEKNARRIAKRLGIKEDIYSFETIRKLRREEK